VVSFYDAFFNEGNIYVALEYMDAGSLADVLAKSGPIPENIIAKIAVQVRTFVFYFN
jgi:serine/threonine protein kinase